MVETNTQFATALRDTFWLPELPEAAAFDTLERIRELEASVVHKRGEPVRPILKADYKQGSAEYDDQLIIANEQDKNLLLTAEHAVDPDRKRKDDENMNLADHGTAGLALLLAERDGATAVVPRGRLTRLSKPDHKVNQAIHSLLPERNGFISLHGMKPGRLTSLSDRIEVHAILGLGRTPNETSRDIAERSIKVAKGLGLRAVIGNDTILKTYDEETGGYVLDAEGKPVEKQLAALASSTTTNRAYQVMAENGVELPALQLEFTRVNRLLPEDYYGGWHKDEKARAMGVYSAYLLSRAIADMVATPAN